MSDTNANLRRKITSAGELQSVVRTMKALAASSIGQYEKSVLSLGDYYRTVQLGMGVCFKSIALRDQPIDATENHDHVGVGAIIFGSDQGLVGQFNEVIADFAIKTFSPLPGKHTIWAVGERVKARLTDAGINTLGDFSIPSSVAGITPLVGQIQLASEAHRAKGDYASVYVFHNQPRPGALYEPVSQRLLPLDQQWQMSLTNIPWPTKSSPEILNGPIPTLHALIREYLFISLFRACAESLASENASRLAAMQRADKNISDSLNELNRTFHRLRQSSIDEELFDVISGFEALNIKGVDQNSND